MAGKGRTTKKEVPRSSREVTKEDQNSGYRVTKEVQDALYQNFFPGPSLRQHYENQVGLRPLDQETTSESGFPNPTSFYAVSTAPLSRGQQMVQAAKDESNLFRSPNTTSPSFPFAGTTYSRLGRRREVPKTFPGYVPSRAAVTKSPEKSKPDLKRKDESLCEILIDDSPDLSSRKSQTTSSVMDTRRFFSQRDEGTFSSSRRNLRPREGNPEGAGSSTASSKKRRSSSSSDEDRKRTDEVITTSVEQGSDSASTPATRRRRGRSLFSASGDDEEETDDFDWRQIKDANQYLEYPKDGPRRLVVTGRDLKTLRSGNFLNDSIIDFYLKYLETEGLDAEIRSRAYFFSCFFYKRLVDRGKHEDETGGLTETARRHDRVKNWTKNTDLFSHDFIVIPVNKGAHWFLVIVCHAGVAFRAATAWLTSSSSPSTSAASTSAYSPRPCILIFDSLGVKFLAAKSCAKTIQSYLIEEYKLKKNVEGEALSATISSCLPWFAPRVPLQPNGSDCGIYVLHFAEKFLQSPFAAVSDEEMKADRRGWFPRNQVAGKRQEIRSLILQLGGFA